MTLDILVTLMLVFGRVAGLLAGLPVFSAKGTPKAAVVFTALGVAVIVAPSVPRVVAPDSVTGLAFGLVGELFLGSMFALGVRAVFAALAMATEVMAQQMGVAMATMFNPLGKHQGGTLGTFASWAAGLVFIGTHMHLRCLEIVGESFHAVPPGTALFGSEGTMWLVDTVGLTITLGVQLAGPVLAMVWIVNVVVAMLAKIAPRMNVFFSVGMTATSTVGIALFAVCLPWIFEIHQRAVHEAVATLATLMSP